MIAVVDYGAGNIHSVLNCLKLLGVDCVLTKKESTMRLCGGIVLPGVGAFGYAMRSLKERGLTEPLRRLVNEGKPLIGICLGMQLLFGNSEEDEAETGLGLIEGKVTRLKAEELKVPHMGWTSLDGVQGKLMKNTRKGEFFYFVHSYACHTKNAAHSAAKATYGETFDAVIEKGNVFGTQFHPEKSSESGRKILRRFLEICGEQEERA